jgi:hypothetical protein
MPSVNHRIIVIDNNGIRQLANPSTQARLSSTLRMTGREFWPTAINVAEAAKSRDPAIRRRLLETLHVLAGTNHAITLPTEVLKRIAHAFAEGQKEIDYSEPSVTGFFREPESFTPDQLNLIREYLIEQEKSFLEAHDQAKEKLGPIMKEAGGRQAWPTIATFLDEVWTVSAHVDGYISALWKNWGLTGEAPVEMLLRHPAWKLFFDGWGAAFYAKTLAHPQPPWAGTADLQQLIYLGITPDGLLVSDDQGLLKLGNAALLGRYGMRQVVSLAEIA